MKEVYLLPRVLYNYIVIILVSIVGFFSSIFDLGDLEKTIFAVGIFLISLSIAELKLLPVYVVAISISGVRRHAPMLAVAVSV